jgi:hypothetical protein
VTIGVGAQYQKDGAIDTSTTPPGQKDAFTFMADALAEENVAGVGTFTLEGQFYKFTDGYAFASLPGAAMPTPILAPKEAFYIVAAYLTPQPIGVGKLQPLVRVQQTIDPGWTIFDGGLAYVFKDYSCRVVATYQHIETGNSFVSNSQNAIQLGVQLQTL